MKYIRKIILFIFSFILICYAYVSLKTTSRTYSSPLTIPFNKYALLLGTSKYMDNGKVNMFFTSRCDGAVELWEKQKIKKIIISGDSTCIQYDEPLLMKQYLLEKGLPDSVFILDKKGYNTRRSILFCKKNHIAHLIIISQQFHNERAVFIANNLGIEAVGYNTKLVYTGYGIRVWIREWFARVKLLGESLLNK